MKLACFCVLCCALFVPLISFCQSRNDGEPTDTVISAKLAHKYIAAVSGKADNVSRDLDRQTEKYITRLAKQEAAMQKKLDKIDAAASKNIFSGSAGTYQELKSDLKNKSERLLKGSGQYISWLDTATGSLKFLGNNNALKNIAAGQAQIKTALSKVHALEDQFKQAENVKEFIRQRKEYLKQQLASYNLGSELKKYNKDAYYFSQEINDYRAALDDPSKLEKKTIQLLNQIPAFSDFMKKYGNLAGLFNIPDDYSTSGVAGLQTRDAVQQLMAERMTMMGPTGAQTAQSNIFDAQSELTQLRDKFMKTGTGGETPDFKVNEQKTKKFSHRLEYGMNLQTARSTYYFPISTDIGFSAGYKLNDKSTVGIGVSSKIGWGKDIHHISVTGQALGLRSFVDIKLKGSFFASGGFEYNYGHVFRSLQQLRSLDTWQPSGLIGISKIISIKSRLFKKTRLQLLWDFMSYSQIPRTQPIKFRIGYSF